MFLHHNYHQIHVKSTILLNILNVIRNEEVNRTDPVYKCINEGMGGGCCLFTEKGPQK